MTTKKNKKNKKVVNEKAETIKEIYAQGEEIRLPSKALNWTAVMIVSICTGLIAGFFGGWWQMRMQPSWMIDKQQQTNNQISSILDLASQQSKTLKKSFDQITLQNLTNQTVLIYNVKEKSSKNDFNNLYSDDNLLGSGLIITSDGWLITNRAVIDDLNDSYLIITSDRQGFEPTDYIVDTFTDLVFFKIDQTDLNPITISSTSSIGFSDNLIVLRNTLKYQQPQINYVQLMSKDYKPIEKLTDYLHSTEKNDSYLQLNKRLASEFNGSLLATSNGEVVGLVYEKAELSLAIPGFYLQVAVINFLNDQTKVSHNSLGIHYLDLAEIVGLPTELHQGYSRGALIYGSASPDKPAVIADSVASQAKLVSGDIILAINEQELNAATNLNKLLQEYPLRSTITLGIQSADGETKEIIVTLDTKP